MTAIATTSASDILLLSVRANKWTLFIGNDDSEHSFASSVPKTRIGMQLGSALPLGLSTGYSAGLNSIETELMQ
jgi:hypothetical protein